MLQNVCVQIHLGPLGKFGDPFEKIELLDSPCYVRSEAHFPHTYLCTQGSRDGVVVIALASHQCDPGSIPDSWPNVG